MDAIKFIGLKQVKVERAPIPQLEEPGDAIVRVVLAGLCGSDMHLYCCREQGLDVGTTMGHEFVGIVEQVGSAVKQVAVGERVVSAFTTCCGVCWFCLHDLPSRCSHPAGAACFGWMSHGKGLQGAQAELVRVPLADGTLVPVPSNVSNQQALLCGDVLATAFYCVDGGRLVELAARQDHVTAVVVGCGPVGLLAVLGARLRGASQVWAVDSVPERLRLAEKFGARLLPRTEDGRVGEAMMEATGGRGADVVLEAVGSQSAIQLAFRLVRPGGNISSVGVHTGTEWGFTPIQGYDKNITYSSGRCPARAYMQQLLAVFGEGEGIAGCDPTAIITDQVSLHDGPAVCHAYDIFDTKAEGCIKVVFNV